MVQKVYQNHIRIVGPRFIVVVVVVVAAAAVVVVVVMVCYGHYIHFFKIIGLYVYTRKPIFSSLHGAFPCFKIRIRIRIYIYIDSYGARVDNKSGLETLHSLFAILSETPIDPIVLRPEPAFQLGYIRFFETMLK